MGEGAGFVGEGAGAGPGVAPPTGAGCVRTTGVAPPPTVAGLVEGTAAGAGGAPAAGAPATGGASVLASRPVAPAGVTTTTPVGAAATEVDPPDAPAWPASIAIKPKVEAAVMPFTKMRVVAAACGLRAIGLTP
ncbi:unannotated protein [freshwater metagenome]|uniref:Unannotated protein n=1 Tax=freshwater metagenome TaxID=449393 RepID=A0A6J6XME1_9ZZZZ